MEPDRGGGNEEGSGGEGCVVAPSKGHCSYVDIVVESTTLSLRVRCMKAACMVVVVEGGKGD